MKLHSIIGSQASTNRAHLIGKRLAKIMARKDVKKPRGEASAGRFSDFLAKHIRDDLDESTKTLEEHVSDEDAKLLDAALYQLFDWDTKSSAHFLKRSNERDAHVPVSAIIETFKKLKAKYPVQIARATQMGNTIGDVTVVIQDYQQHLNIVLALGKKAVIKTIMSIDPDQFHLSGREMKFKV